MLIQCDLNTYDVSWVKPCSSPNEAYLLPMINAHSMEVTLMSSIFLNEIPKTVVPQILTWNHTLSFTGVCVEGKHLRKTEGGYFVKGCTSAPITLGKLFFVNDSAVNSQNLPNKHKGVCLVVKSKNVKCQRDCNILFRPDTIAGRIAILPWFSLANKHTVWFPQQI